MAKTILTLCVVVLLLAMQPQARAASKGTHADGCKPLANAIHALVLQAAEQDENHTGSRTSQKRIHCGSIMTGSPTGCGDATYVATAAFHLALGNVGPPGDTGKKFANSGDFSFSHQTMVEVLK